LAGDNLRVSAESEADECFRANDDYRIRASNFWHCRLAGGFPIFLSGRALANKKTARRRLFYSNCKLGALVVRSPQRRIYFGRIVGSPPGLPGGGMTGILPVSGVGARISGSIPVGGQSTPSDLASLSLSGSACGSVVVVPCGAMVLCCGIDCVGAQPVAFLGAGGAV